MHPDTLTNESNGLYFIGCSSIYSMQNDILSDDKSNAFYSIGCSWMQPSKNKSDLFITTFLPSTNHRFQNC